MAEQLVDEWHRQETRDQNMFFDPQKKAPLNTMLNLLRMGNLCDGNFKLRDRMHGGPILLNGRTEITFADLEFARAVKNALEANEYCRTVEILQAVT
jgi:hypothetical protein